MKVHDKQLNKAIERLYTSQTQRLPIIQSENKLKKLNKTFLSNMKSECLQAFSLQDESNQYLKSQLKEMRDSLQQRNQLIQQLNQAFHIIFADYRKIHFHLEVMKSYHSDSSNNIAILQSKNQELQNQLKQEQVTNSNLRSDLISLYQKYQTETTSLQSILKTTESQINLLQEEINSMHSENDIYKQRVKNLSQKLNDDIHNISNIVKFELPKIQIQQLQQQQLHQQQMQYQIHQLKSVSISGDFSQNNKQTSSQPQYLQKMLQKTSDQILNSQHEKNFSSEQIQQGEQKPNITNQQKEIELNKHQEEPKQMDISKLNQSFELSRVQV